MYSSPFAYVDFGLVLSSIADGTQPGNAIDKLVTPGTNAYGAYTQLLAGAAVTDDCYEIEITVSGRGNVQPDALVAIGADPAGGSSYTDIIADLVCGPVWSYFDGAEWSTSGGCVFTFPLYIRAGTSLAARGSVQAGVLGLGVSIILRARPSHPELLPRGAFVTTLGSVLANSAGTAIVPGLVSEGAWTQIGGALTTPLWWWEFGYGLRAGLASAGRTHVDIAIGDASNKKIIIANAPIVRATNLTQRKMSAGRYGLGNIGDLVYARAQTVGAGGNGGNQSIAVYGVGG